MISFILKAVLLGVTITFLLSWGYVKQQRKAEELYRKLGIKCEAKIIKKMKTEGAITVKEIEEIISGTKGTVIWSKNKMQVTNSKIATKTILENLINSGVITEAVEKGPKKYCLK
ncbi:hypothetical protein [Clostridium sp.]|uniref:hypothetical protein n=1 Tax=Clostridium sp. TaxID=1506 RepID=UPI001A3B7EB1|nr:hypothetical protein [Clostridium sp.]MBK5242363.1 hypothetical protein [Clostridium sp.]